MPDKTAGHTKQGMQDAQRKMEELLARDAEVNAVNQKGQTALMAAAMQGGADVVHLLLTHGADATLQSQSGTALAFAEALGHAEIVEILHDAGAH